eukprot:3395930-Pleurochrysis_carterae.AAC.1
MTAELINPIAIEQGMRFAIREGGRTINKNMDRLKVVIPKLRIALKAYEATLLNNSCQQILQAVKGENSLKVIGPVPLPTKRRIYCVLRSPHVNKDAREHFEIRTHKRLIDIYKATETTLENLRNLDLPAGVDMEIKNV